MVSSTMCYFQSIDFIMKPILLRQVKFSFSEKATKLCTIFPSFSNIIEKPHTLVFFHQFINYVICRFLQVYAIFCSNLVEYYGVNDTYSNFASFCY